MNWRNEFLKRRKEILRLEKMIKKVGTMNSLEIIRETLENTYGYPTRIRKDVGKNARRLVMYSLDATPKQIQYGRCEKEIGSLIVQGIDDKLFIYIRKDEIPCCIDMPDTINEIYNILCNKKGKNGIKQSI